MTTVADHEREQVSFTKALRARFAPGSLHF